MSAISSSIAAGLTGVDLSSQVSVRVARLTLDQAQQQGQAAVDLLKAAADVGQQTQQQGGGGLDVTA